jgi:hypothetical protein
VSHTTIALAAALGGSLFLLSPKKARVAAIVAAITSGVLVAMSLGVVSISVRYVELGLTVALAVAGVVLVMRVEQKLRVVAATVVAAVGVVLALQALL